VYLFRNKHKFNLTSFFEHISAVRGCINQLSRNNSSKRADVRGIVGAKTA